MGRDYSQGTGKGVRAGGSGGGGCDPTVATGCMSSVFRFFDFHHFQLCYHLNHNQQHGNAADHFHSPSSTSQSQKGLEAPRNSSESEDSAPSNAKPVSEHVTFPQMSVKTKRRPMKTNPILSIGEFSEDSLSSPGSRTPSLVARLMGLDLLPETNSPAPSSSSSSKLPLTHPTRKQIKNSGTQSLPESPRTSLARWSDVDLHHRLSLQVNNDKEGSKEDEVLCKRRELIKSMVQNSETEGWSPGHYAKQIVKQVKESVVRSRRVGLAEITNTVRGRAVTEHRRDEHLLPSSATLLSSKKRTQKTTTSFRSQDVENQPPTTSPNTQKQVPLSPSPSPSTSTTIPTKVKSFSSNEKTSPNHKCRKAVEDKFKFKFTTSSSAQSSSKNNKELEPLFIRPTPNQHRNKCPLIPKKTPLSTIDEQFNITSTTTATRTGLRLTKQVVKVSDTQGQQQQQQLQLEKQIYFSNDEKTRTGHETRYVSKILKCMGIGNHTRVSTISNWFSPSHPLNPSIFHLLEPISSSTNSIPKCNRLLIFELTDQILAEMLQHSVCAAGYEMIMHMNGEQLVKLLTLKMESFPLSNCEVLEDVDALVGSDFNRVDPSEDEKGSVVREVEREILDCLLFETTALL